MAFFEMHYYSMALRQSVALNVILPEIPKKQEGAGAPAGTYKTLYLLHGLSGDCTAWTRKSSIERYADEYGIAVVMPSVGRSWYADTAYGTKYFTFVAEELPAVCRSYFKGMSDKREDNFVAGLSMGGYGAAKLALSYPERYFGFATLSGALDVTRKGRACDMVDWRANFGYDWEVPAELAGSDNDVFYLAERNKNEGRPHPKTFIWCGTEDALISTNREFRDHLAALDLPCNYNESEGDHTWRWWDMHIQAALKYLLGE